MTETESLLDAIEAMPDDDALRGAFADELEKDGYSPRAELIRLQIEIERKVLTGTPSKRSEDRESQLLTQHAAEFRRGPKCETCDGKGGLRTSMGRLVTQCGNCLGTGDVGGLMRKVGMASAGRKHDWLHEVEWHRGFPRVHCRMEECVIQGFKKGFPNQPDPRPSDWLLSVVRHHRGVEVWVTDKKPNDNTFPDKPCWFFNAGTGLMYDHWLPRCLLPTMREMYPNADWSNQGLHDESWIMTLKTVDECQVALARAIPAWARTFLKEKS